MDNWQAVDQGVLHALPENRIVKKRLAVGQPRPLVGVPQHVRFLTAQQNEPEDRVDVSHREDQNRRRDKAVGPQIHSSRFHW